MYSERKKDDGKGEKQDLARGNADSFDKAEGG